MSDPALALVMLGVLVFTIMIGFPVAFTLMALGVSFGYYAYDSYRIKEMSINSPIGIPIWQIKMMIPIGAALLSLQGLAEVARCILALRENEWPQRLHDVEELEQQLMHDKKIQKAIMEQGALP